MANGLDKSTNQLNEAKEQIAKKDNELKEMW